MIRPVVLLVLGLSGVVGTSVMAQPVDECGFLGHEFGCVVFEPTTDAEPYVTDLDSIPDSLLYTPVRLRGKAISCQHDCAGWTFRNCIVVAQLSVCEPLDLGCGVLSGSYDDQCWVWTSPVYGRLLTELHGYSPGDVVHAFGVVDRRCASICMVGEGCLWMETFSACEDTTTATHAVSWGSLKRRFK